MTRTADQDFIAIETAGGTRICVPPTADCLTTYVLLEQEDWFEPELAFLRRRARPGLRVLDIGANFGVYALPLAVAAGPAGRVFAFEPSVATGAYLRAGIAENGLENIELFDLALSNREGTATLTGAAPELNAIFFSATEDAAGTGERVSVTTLDGWAADRDIGAVAVVKIDAEGEETNVVAGGRRFFAEQDPLVMVEVRQGDRLDLAAVDLLGESGYAPYRLVPGLDALAPLTRDPDSGAPDLDPYQLNLFCAKAGRAESLAQDGYLVREEADPAPAADEARWQAWMADRPYAQLFAGRTAFAGRPGEGDYRAALAHFVAAEDTETGIAGRHAHLSAAVLAVDRALAAHQSLSRLCTGARIYAAFGARQKAANALADASGRLGQAQAVPDEPFLAPAAAFDDGADKDPNVWITLAVMETLVRLFGQSSCFVGAKTRPVVEQLARSGLASPEIERRAHLIRIKARQDIVPPSAKLTETGPGNRNAALWRQSGLVRWAVRS